MKHINETKTTFVSRFITIFILVIILITGLMLRLQAVAYTEVYRPIKADAYEYIAYAHNLKYSGVYSNKITPDTDRLLPDALRTPGYPLFVSLFIDKDITWKALSSLLFAQVLLSTAVIILAYIIFSVVIGGKLALLVASLAALSPHLININVYFLSETFFTFLLMMFLWILSRLRSPPKIYLLIILGTLLAAASLTRPWIQYFILILIPLFVSWKSRLSVVIPFLAIMSLWIIRNIITLGLIADNTSMMTSIYHGIYPYFLYEGRPETYGFPYRFDPRAQEISTSLYTVFKELMRRFSEVPLTHLQWYLIGKPMTLFSWNIIQGMGDVFIYEVTRTPYSEMRHFKITHSIMYILHVPLVVLAIIGSIAAWIDLKRLEINEDSLFLIRCISLLLGYYVLVHIVAAPFPRYTIAMLPIIYGMAIFGGLQLFIWVRSVYIQYREFLK